MHIETILKNYGLSDKEVSVYTTLLELGPSPVRSISEKSKVNRGTTYDILKALIEEGLVAFYHKEKKQFFVVEPPEKIIHALSSKQNKLGSLKSQVELSLPELKSLYEKEGGKPQVKLYEGLKGIRQILEDVLDTVSVSNDKTYYVYSSAQVRKDVYEAMPDFSEKRKKKKIQVKTIAVGEGGRLVGLDERKWLSKKVSKNATYEIIYFGKVAHISTGTESGPIGVLITNNDIYETQKVVFEHNWETL